MDKNRLFQKLPVKGMITAITCFLIITASVTVMARMVFQKNPPERKKPTVSKLSVSTVPVIKKEISLTITGYGQADPVHVAIICPEVSGRIIQKHRALDAGGMVTKGDTLLKIDDTDYVIEADKAGIRVSLQENQIQQLKVSAERDKGRLKAIQENTKIAEAEYLRLKKLYETSRVGTLSAVETAEQSYNSLADTEKSLVKSLDLYPLQIAEAQNNLADAKSDLKTARINVERCTITAPFSGRVKESSVETGTYISKGTQALTLADDQVLEIQVPLSDKDAFEGLSLKGSTPGRISGLENIGCRVETVTGNVSADFPGKVHRAVKYDADSRTLYLAVRVYENDSAGSGESIPIMDGMFCKVYFSGKPVEDAVKIPASLLNPDNSVYLARNSRLQTLAVEKIMEDGDDIYISGAFEPSDQIITTPLANPIENTLLEAVVPENETAVSNALALLQEN